MIPVPAVVENESSDAQRATEAARNANTTTRVTGVPTILDKSPEVGIDEESNSEEETESLGDGVNVHDI